MQKSVSPEVELKERVRRSIEALRETNQDFENAHDTYLQQYGQDAITVNEPMNLGDTIDPVALVLGRNCVAYYHDSSKSLSGTLGSLNLTAGVAFIIGRREPQDSKLCVWNPLEGLQVDLSEYNPSASRIPSRIHGALIVSDDTNTYFTDLGSSAGTVVVGESRKSGPFVRVYDPGTSKFPTIRMERIATQRKW